MTDSVWYHAVMLIVLMGAFIGLWLWAWGRKRRKTFHQASLMPLEDDHAVSPDAEQKKD